MYTLVNKLHHSCVLIQQTFKMAIIFIARFNSATLYSVKDKKDLKVQMKTYLVVSEDLDVGEGVLVEDVLEVEVQLSLVRLHSRSNSKLSS